MPLLSGFTVVIGLASSCSQSSPVPEATKPGWVDRAGGDPLGGDAMRGARDAIARMAGPASGAPITIAPDPAGPPPGAASAADRVAPGTRRMAARLEEIIRNLDPLQNRFANTGRVEVLQRALERRPEMKDRVILLPRLADELLGAGRADEALEVARRLLQARRDGIPGAPPDRDTHEFMALCWLRIGEQDNCIRHHNTESCLLPIRGGGVHRAQRGARGAIDEYTAVLMATPGDAGSRWLLNIAYQTLGNYPEAVPPEFLIPPSTFAPEHDIGRFVDVAPAAGLAKRSHAGGGVMDDFDGDGLLDIMVSSMGMHDQLRFFRNDGDGTFTDRSATAGLLGEVGGLNIIHADYDNDGDNDVVVLRGGWMQRGGKFPKSLLRNRGDGWFEDVTEEAGMLSYHPTQTGAFADYDGDGWLDLAIGNEAMADDPQPCELFHSNRDGSFTERAVNLGNPVLGYVKGVTWGDFNNDGRPDLYVSVLGGPNRLFRNDGPRRASGPGDPDWVFTDVAPQAGVTGPRFSFPTWFWDFDNDGWLDIMAGGYRVTPLDDTVAMYLGQPNASELPKLYRNRGDGNFEDVTAAMRLDRVVLPMGSNFGDLDNDGWPDCYFGDGSPDLRSLIPNRLFRNDAGRGFQDVTTSTGMGHIQKGHGVAFGDIDNDGDQDVFEAMGGWFEGDIAYNVLYKNPGHGNHWVTLRLEGRRSNRSAIGTRIKVTLETPRGPRDIHATVTWGGSFGGSSLQQEIGLGDATGIRTLEVRWPASGIVQTFRDVAMDRVWLVVETESRLDPVAVRRFDLP